MNPVPRWVVCQATTKLPASSIAMDGMCLVAGGRGMHLDFTAERDAVGIEALGVHTPAVAVLVLALPDHDVTTVGGYGDVGVLLGIGRGRA